VNEAAKYEASDAARKELAELKNQADTLVYTTEQALEGYADLLEPAVLDEVKARVAELRKVLEGVGDLAALREAYQKLEAAAFKIAETMYGTAG
jgi:molecular chaperone DnaK